MKMVLGWLGWLIAGTYQAYRSKTHPTTYNRCPKAAAEEQT